MKKESSKKMASVPESWIEKFYDLSAENAEAELVISSMEVHIQELIDCVMAQGKMLEDVGIEPLTPEIMLSMAKTLDSKEKELSKRERELRSVVPDKKEWN